MKGKKVIKIILGFIIAVVIIATIMVFVIGVDKTNGDGIFSFGSTNVSGLYDNSSEYKIGGADINSNELKYIDINWIRGSVDILPYDGDDVRISEAFVSGENSDENIVRYLVKDGRLTIQFTKAQGFFERLFAKPLVKNLTVLIPEDKMDINTLNVDTVGASLKASALTLETLDIDNVSGNIDISDITAAQVVVDNVSGKLAIEQMTSNHVRIDTVSGEIFLADVNTETLKMNTVNGKVNYSGDAKEIDADAVSAHMSVTLDNAPEKVDCESVSGDIIFKIPDNDGFSLDFETVSGTLASDFPLKSESKHKSSYGNGGFNYEFETVSGALKVLKAD